MDDRNPDAEYNPYCNTNVGVETYITELGYITVRADLEIMKKNGVDTLILGCTHFPHLSGIIGDIMGKDVTLISSGAELAKFAARALKEEDALCSREGEGSRELYCTDSVELFTENTEVFLGKDTKASIKKCTLKT